MKSERELPAILPPGSVMEYAPINELGVVALFAEWAKTKRIRINRIQAGFPDCIATLPTGRGSKRIRIEFEFKSSSFRAHGHDAKGCDWIVCWEHDWPEVPARISVIELRKEFGFGFSVWICPVSNKGTREDYSAMLRERATKAIDWSMPRNANKGDLILFYHAAPISGIADIFRMISPVVVEKKTWRLGKEEDNDYFAHATRVARLGAPVHLVHFRNHPVLRDAGFVRARFRGRARVTQYWPFIRDLVIELNPPVKRQLRRYW